MKSTLVASSKNRKVAELVHQLLVDRRLGVEVEVLERHGDGQAGEALETGPPAYLGGGDFDLEQAFQEGRCDRAFRCVAWSSSPGSASAAAPSRR